MQKKKVPAKPTVKPRTTGGISGKNSSKINPVYREQESVKIPGFKFGKGTEQLMSGGQRKRHDGFNKSIIRDGVIVILRKDGRERMRLDRKTKQPIKGNK